MNPFPPAVIVPRVARAFLPLASLVVLSCLAAGAHAGVIEVGPARAVKTLDAAVARAAVGDEIVLERGIEHLTAGVRVTTDAIEIRSAEGSGAPATIRNVSTKDLAATIEHRGEGLVLKDLIFTGGSNVTCIRARGQRLTIDNAEPTDAVGRWVQISGGSQTTIRNCDVPKLKSYAVCSFDHDARVLLIERCTFAGGDRDSHTIRLQRIYAARLLDCTINGVGARSALSIRDGADNRVENCTINGRLYIGPLADGDGGINHPTTTAAERAKREELLRRTQRNALFRDCTIDTDGITVEMGAANLTFDGCRIKTMRSWVLRLNVDGYAPWRNVPAGQVVNCALTGPDGLKVFEHGRPDFHVLNTTVNGVRIPNSAPVNTTSPVEPGGAAPSEATPTPATSSAPAPTRGPAVLRFDLIDATAGAVLRELKDGDVLPAIMPASVNVVVSTEPPSVGSVRVIHNGVVRWEHTRPYTIGYPALDLSAGTHTIEATAFTASEGTGQAGRAAKITVTRASASPPPTPSTPAPSTQPSDPTIADDVRRADLLAAIDHLTVALQRLRSSTQPSP